MTSTRRVKDRRSGGIFVGWRSGCADEGAPGQSGRRSGSGSSTSPRTPKMIYVDVAKRHTQEQGAKLDRIPLPPALFA